MNVVDLILIAPLALLAFQGFKRGLIIELAGLLALIGGIYGAIRFSQYTETLIEGNIDVDESYLPMLSFAVTLLIIVFGVHFLAKVLTKTVKLMALGIPNRIAGAFFGLAKGVIIVSGLLIVFESMNQKLHLMDAKQSRESLLFEPISKVTPGLLPVVTQTSWYREFQSMELLDNLPITIED